MKALCWRCQVVLAPRQFGGRSVGVARFQILTNIRVISDELLREKVKYKLLLRYY